MMHHRFTSRFTYPVDYILKGCRKSWCVHLTGESEVAIREIDPTAAPVAYDVTCLKYGAHHEIRIFDGSLWWPMLKDSVPLKATDFLAMVKNDWETASAILDPSHRTYEELGPTFEEFFKNKVVRKKGFRSAWSDRSVGAERDASRMIFCEGHVLVEAGEPVWYAVPDRETRDSFDLFIGHSALDRRNVPSYSTPGPDRGIRLTSARMARAFGLGEIEPIFGAMSGHLIQYKSEIMARQDRATGPAAELCARALAHYLWEIARWHPDLRRAIPAIATAHGAPPEELPVRKMLEQLAMYQDPHDNRNISFLITDAHRLLERLSASEGFAEEDTSALAALAM
jgi:hypothetical protein